VNDLTRFLETVDFLLGGRDEIYFYTSGSGDAKNVDHRVWNKFHISVE